MLDARRLLLLRELRDRGSIAAVAEALSYTPSAVSQQLAILRRETGVELVERIGRGVRLTDAGRTLAAHADAVLEQLEAAEAAIESATPGQLRGTARVAAYQTAARAMLGPAITDLAESHPGIRLELAELEAELALPLLRTGEADVVVAEEYTFAPRPRDPGAERHPLGVDRVLLALAPGHPAAASTGAIHLRDLEQEPWATSRPGTLFAESLVRACRTIGGFEPDIRHRANDVGLLLQLAADGHAVVLVPAMGVAVRPEGVVLREVAGRGLTRDVFAVTRRGTAERPAIAAVLGVLRAQAERLGLRSRGTS